MQLDHERLDVYDLALDFLVLANGSMLVRVVSMLIKFAQRLGCHFDGMTARQSWPFATTDRSA